MFPVLVIPEVVVEDTTEEPEGQVVFPVAPDMALQAVVVLAMLEVSPILPQPVD